MKKLIISIAAVRLCAGEYEEGLALYRDGNRVKVNQRTCAIVSGSSGTAQAKKAAFEAVGVTVGRTPSETAELMRRILRGK